MNKPLAAITLVSCCVLFMHCGKLGKSEPAYRYTVTNNTDKKILFDVYQSESDFDSFKNKILQLSIKPGEATELPFTAMENYYLDWYSEDYTANNWYNYNVSASGGGLPNPAIQYIPPKIDDQLSISYTFPDTARSIMMNGTQTSSKWLAVFQYSGPSTSTPPYIEVFFRKNFTASVKTLSTTGDTLETNYVYTVSSSSSFGIKTMSVIVREDLSTGTPVYNFVFDPTITDRHMSRDTLFCVSYDVFGNKGYSFARR